MNQKFNTSKVSFIKEVLNDLPEIVCVLKGGAFFPINSNDFKKSVDFIESLFWLKELKVRKISRLTNRLDFS
jgi:hypothetical protein